MIQMIQSIKIQLLPNNKQRTKLFQFAGAARYAYNWALDKQFTNTHVKLENITGSKKKTVRN